MRKNFIALLMMMNVMLVLPLTAEKFEFKYTKGDKYKILSTVNEDVFVNGEFHHNAEIINRISVNVTDVNPNGSGVHSAHFMTTENSVGAAKNVYNWGQEYESVFVRDKNGTYTISDEYFMPVVRDVPIFPDKDLKVGDTWTATGHEAHDLRQQFDMKTPFKVPFTAKYTYQGTTNIDEKIYHIIKVSYQLFFNNPLPENIYENDNGADYPLITRGFSNQTLFWDNEKGLIQSYEENFRIEIETLLGNIFVFKGRANAEVSEIESVNTPITVEKVQEQIEKMGIENTSVNSSEKGITISIENIQFKANSAILEKSEIKKLEKISKILETFPSNDLLISGHTARSGSEESCQALSEERADSVAEFLINRGTKKPNQVFTQGFGSTKPIDTNSNTRGMARNRRVEITIMEK